MNGGRVSKIFEEWGLKPVSLAHWGDLEEYLDGDSEHDWEMHHWEAKAMRDALVENSYSRERLPLQMFQLGVLRGIQIEKEKTATKKRS